MPHTILVLKLSREQLYKYSGLAAVCNLHNEVHGNQGRREKLSLICSLANSGYGLSEAFSGPGMPYTHNMPVQGPYTTQKCFQKIGKWIVVYLGWQKGMVCNHTW